MMRRALYLACTSRMVPVAVCKTPSAGMRLSGRALCAATQVAVGKDEKFAGYTESGWDYNVQSSKQHAYLPSTWPAKPCEWQSATVVKDGEKPRGPQSYYPEFKYHLPYDLSKYRLYGIPESFFTFMHERTGVLGPYFLLWGGMMTAFSKEYMIINEEFGAFLMFFIMPLYVASKVGPAIDRGVRETYNEQMMTLEKMKRCKSQAFTNEADAIELDVARSEAGKEVFDAYNLNVENMIEAEYRLRQEQVFQAFKRRLDYQLALQNLEESIVQKQLVSWVKDEVSKAIKSRGEKENIRQCIADLKSIAAA